MKRSSSEFVPAAPRVVPAALNAHHSSAQGNALGNMSPITRSPEKAKPGLAINLARLNAACAFVLGFCLCAVAIRAAVISESFTNNPAADGWRVFGDTNLFQWDSTNHDLAVTWDSSRPNSYFYHPLGTVLSKSDDFTLAFDLYLNDIATGVRTNAPYSFDLSIGFLNLRGATNASFLRGTGSDSPNLVEFAYFVDPVYGDSLLPGISTTNSLFNYTGYAPVTMPVGTPLHFSLTYASSNETLYTLVTTNGNSIVVNYADALDPALFASNDFRVDTVSIPSYSDVNGYGGSLLAHGTLANLTVTVPPPPVQQLQGGFAAGQWQASFSSQTNWAYILEGSADLNAWSAVSAAARGTGGTLTLQDTNAAPALRFYRVQAQRLP